MPTILPIVAITAGPPGLHAHRASASVLRLRLSVAAVPASDVLDVSYAVDGLKSTDVLFAAKADEFTGTGGLGLFFVGAWAGNNLLTVRLGNLLPTASGDGELTLYAWLLRPGGEGHIRVDPLTPLTPQ